MKNIVYPHYFDKDEFYKRIGNKINIVLDDINKLYNRKFFIKYDYDNNIKEYNHNLKLCYNFIICNEYFGSIFFIYYRNDNDCYIQSTVYNSGNLINKGLTNTDIDSVLEYIKENITFMFIYKDLKYLLEKIKNLDELVQYCITNNTTNYYDINKERFLDKIDDGIYQKYLLDKYDYLINASKFDLI